MSVFLILTLLLLQVKMQVAFMLGRHQVFLELPEEMDDYEDFTEILSNSHLNTHFLSLGREVGVLLQTFRWM